MDSLDPEIRRVVLAGMRQALPDARTEARVLAGLLARIGEGGPGDPGGAPGDPGSALASSTGLGATLKMVVGAVVVGAAIVGGVAVATAEPEAPAQRSASAPTSAPAPTPPSRVKAPAPSPIATPVPSPAIAPPPAKHDPGPARAKPTVAPTVAPPDELAAEAEIIAQAEAALAGGDPERALALARTHAQRHPTGQLALEGEAIRVAAACVAKHEGARDSADRFLRRHPRSPAATKVRARCGASAEIDEGQ